MSLSDVDLAEMEIKRLQDIIHGLQAQIQGLSVPLVTKADGTVIPYAPGDVFQINEKHGRAGWIGAFVLATEIRSWGIQGFVHVVEKHEESARAYIRLNWEHVDYIGRAVLIPSDEVSSP